MTSFNAVSVPLENEGSYEQAHRTCVHTNARLSPLGFTGLPLRFSVPIAVEVLPLLEKISAEWLGGGVC